MDMHIHTGIVFIYHGQILFWMEKLNFLLACRQIFLLYIGLYWVTIGLGISHRINAAPRVSGAWDPGARQGGIRALKVRVALGAEGSGLWFLVLGSQGSGSLGR